MRKYRDDGQLENFSVLEGIIESNENQKLDTLIYHTLKDLTSTASETLIHEATELCLLFAKPRCLRVMIDYASKRQMVLQANQIEENLSLVALLSTACQESSKLRDLFDCLLILLEYDPVLLSEAAGDQFDEPFNRMPAAVFFAVQVLEQFRDLEDQILIQQFEKLSLIPFVITPGECPSLVHYAAMHGRYQLLEWIVQCIKSDFPEELSAVLNKSANFGEEIGLLSITPLVCAITSEDVDTVAVLSKEKVNLEKCKIFKKRPERKNGRCADRQRKLINDAAKTPNEIASSIKDKKSRVAIKTLLRKQQDNARFRHEMNSSRMAVKNGPRESGDGRRKAQKH